MSNTLPIQQPCKARPICTKCMHGHQVEIITDRGITESSLEYHCRFCGNYAVVGKPARWPFMTIVKHGENYSKVMPRPVNQTDNGTSPLQTGEKLKKEKSMSTPVLKCIVDGCDEPVAASHLCAGHFQGQYGITVAEYRDNRRWKTESPKKVAMRMKNEDEADRIKRNQDAKETFDQAMQEEKEKVETTAANHVEKQEMEKKTPKPEAKVWPGEDAKMEGVFDPDTTFIAVCLKRDITEALTKLAIAEYRTPQQQAAYLLDKALREQV